MSFWRPGEGKPSPEGADKSAAKTPPSASPKARLSLSDNVMGMKFMKRGAEEEREEKEWKEREDASKRRRLIEEEESRAGTKLEIEFTLSEATSISSYPGRRSFGGFNKIVERQYSSILEGKRLDHKYRNRSAEDDVDDDELIERYAAMRNMKNPLSSGEKKKEKKKKGDKKGKGTKNLK